LGLTVGLTSTIPVEIVLAAGCKPLDLNNVFITSRAPEKLIQQAEQAGFAHNICAWIKGIYSATLERHIPCVIAVTGGDCSNTTALAEVLERRGVRVLPFDFPLDRDPVLLRRQMEKLSRALGAHWREVERIRARLGTIRRKLQELDRLTYEENRVSGLENHRFLVASSDFNSDPETYEKELDQFLREAAARPAREGSIRLGYLGVPPIFSDLYEFVESVGGRVVFNEVQRQFSMPRLEGDIVDQYLTYTYPYGIRGRLEDIRKAIEERRLDGLIHYTQTFCFRQIYDILLRESLPLPVLTIEGDKPGKVDSRTAIRLETFVEMLKMRKGDQWME
jgi:benzoyl-CoA reductase/2-hydroxyglutaryl-CoA dehydratase subunit BcrC/BadD/HgdB